MRVPGVIVAAGLLAGLALSVWPVAAVAQEEEVERSASTDGSRHGDTLRAEAESGETATVVITPRWVPAPSADGGSSVNVSGPPPIPFVGASAVESGGGLGFPVPCAIEGWASACPEPAAGGAGSLLAAPVGGVVSSAMLLDAAWAELSAPMPSLHLNPEGDQIVQLPSWLWIDPDQWAPVSATATAGAVSATVTASPARVLWSMGNGDVVTCDGPGRVYAPRFAESPEATDCKYTYRHSSADQPGESYGVTATIEWEASWSGSDGDGGDLGVLTTTAVDDVRVAELQALTQ